MNPRRVAAALRQIASAVEDIADELEPDREPERLDPALEGDELRKALAQLQSIELEGALHRALHRFTRPRTPSA